MVFTSTRLHRWSGTVATVKPFDQRSGEGRSHAFAYAYTVASTGSTGK